MVFHFVLKYPGFLINKGIPVHVHVILEKWQQEHSTVVCGNHWLSSFTPWGLEGLAHTEQSLVNTRVHTINADLDKWVHSDLSCHAGLPLIPVQLGNPLWLPCPIGRSQLPQGAVWCWPGWCETFRHVPFTFSAGSGNEKLLIKVTDGGSCLNLEWHKELKEVTWWPTFQHCVIMARWEFLLIFFFHLYIGRVKENICPLEGGLGSCYNVPWHSMT